MVPVGGLRDRFEARGILLWLYMLIGDPGGGVGVIGSRRTAASVPARRG
jgi:hypothetical protein